MARVTRPGGAVVIDFYNARSVRAVAKRLAGPGRIGAGGQVTEADVFTRWDDLAALRARLPEGLELERVDGVRILAPAAAVFNLPLLGPAWTALERAAMRTPLKRFGGFLVLTLRRR